MAKLSSTSVYGNLYVDGEIVNSALDAELGQSIKSLSVNGKTITYTKNDGTTGTIETQDTNTTYGNATTSTSGLMSSADKTKLDGIAANANNYSHPTTSGNKHIPAGGSSGQILRWASDGTAVWGNDNNTTYSTGTASTAGLTKLYTGTGTATDGTMTQSAINSALSGKVNKTGDTMTGSLKNSLNTGTWLAGNQGTALLSSTNDAGYFTTLVKSNSANGYFALSNYQNSFYLTYTAKTTVDAGTNSTTKSAVLLNESGDSTFPGRVTASSFSGALSGNASTATKLQTVRTINGTNFDGSGNITTSKWGVARTIGLSGDVSGSVSIDGSANATITARRRHCICGQTTTADTTNCYFKVASFSTTSNYIDARISFYVSSDYSATDGGILHVLCRRGNEASSIDLKNLVWDYAYGINSSDFQLVSITSGTTTTFELWLKVTYSHRCYRFNVIDEGNRGNANNIWTLHNSQNTASSTGGKSAVTSGGTVTNSTFSSISNNSYTATRLQTGRSINGTNFDGTGNITTANWGTARNIQIGNTTKSVNGSANVSWSLSEIGAAASSHTHSNYASTSHTHSSLTGTVGSTTAPSTETGVMRYDYNVSSANAGTLPNNNNANGILTLNTHSGNYYNQLGFSSNGNLYYRAFNGKALDTTTAWKQIAFTDSNITGNAATATKLQTVRTINGTNFDGTSNITTANWGTARNIQIGNASKSVNGSENVSWTLSEIGAAASSHTHNYAGSSSAGGNANAAVKLATARTINGTNFDGTGNITTANWGTARNIQIGNAVKSVNGSGNVSWNWSEMQVPRAYSSSYNFGGNQNAITTEQFITMLTNLGAFSQVYWVSRGSWSYATNQYINDTGCGNIHLAGCVVEVIGTTSAYTIRVTTPTTSASGTINAEFIYVNNGTDYSPGWRRQYNTKNKPTASEIGAAAASHTHSYLPLTGGTLSGNVVLNNNIAIGSKDTSGTTKWLAWVDKANNAQFGDVAIKSVINSNANPEVNVGGKGIYTLYHTGNKPTPSEIGAAVTSHTHNYLPLTGGTLSGHVALENNTAVMGKDTSGATQLLTWVDSANNAQFGNTSIKSVINSSVNPEVNISGKGVCTLYHTGNKPTAAEIGAGPALALANGFYGMVTNDGNSANWIRTTQNGIIPYQSGGSSSLGTASWPFNEVYATNFYGTLKGNATHWGGRQVWWGAAASRPGNGYIQFVW